MGLPEQNSAENLEIKESALVTAGWSAEARKDAFERTMKSGLPTARDEYWKYTNPKSLTSKKVEKAPLSQEKDGAMFTGANPIKIVFVDGKFAPKKSADFEVSGLSVERLSIINKLDLHWAKDLYGKYGKSLANLGKSGFVWSDYEFVAYVADPKKYLVDKLGDKKARSKMSYKLKNETDALNIWAYLKSVSK